MMVETLIPKLGDHGEGRLHGLDWVVSRNPAVKSHAFFHKPGDVPLTQWRSMTTGQRLEVNCTRKEHRQAHDKKNNLPTLIQQTERRLNRQLNAKKPSPNSPAIIKELNELLAGYKREMSTIDQVIVDTDRALILTPHEHSSG